MKERRVTSQQVAKAGGLVPFISQLVDALRSGNMDQRKASAMSLKCLTEQASLHEVAEAAKKENSVLIAEAGGIPPLVELLGHDSESQGYALTALAHISSGRVPYQQAMLDAGAVPKISQCLRGGDAATQAAAAAAMAALSQLEPSRHPFRQAGTVLSLVSLLKGGTDSQVHAAQSLANLAKGSREVGASISKAGAVPLLVGLLESGKAQEAASHALESLTEHNEEIQAEVRASSRTTPPPPRHLHPPPSPSFEARHPERIAASASPLASRSILRSSSDT